MNCNLRVQAGPEIKGEVISPSWENREKFAASREKCFRTEDTRQKHGYIISSYEPLADLFFLYFKIAKKKKKKCCKKILSFNLFYTDFSFCSSREPTQKVIKKKSKKNYV